LLRALEFVRSNLSLEEIMSDTPDRSEVPSFNAGDDGLTSDDLAALIIDALLRADVVKKEDVEQAMKIAIEEIEVRKAMGDY
jgi:hypothetical protein